MVAVRQKALQTEEEARGAREQYGEIQAQLKQLSAEKDKLVEERQAAFVEHETLKTQLSGIMNCF